MNSACKEALSFCSPQWKKIIVLHQVSRFAFSLFAFLYRRKHFRLSAEEAVRTLLLLFPLCQSRHSCRGLEPRSPSALTALDLHLLMPREVSEPPRWERAIPVGKQGCALFLMWRHGGAVVMLKDPCQLGSLGDPCMGGDTDPTAHSCAAALSLWEASFKLCPCLQDLTMNWVPPGSRQLLSTCWRNLTHKVLTHWAEEWGKSRELPGFTSEALETCWGTTLFNEFCWTLAVKSAFLWTKFLSLQLQKWLKQHFLMIHL